MWSERGAEDDREIKSRCFGENKESRRSSKCMLAFRSTSAGNGDWALRRNGYPASQGSVRGRPGLARSKRRSSPTLFRSTARASKPKLRSSEGLSQSTHGPRDSVATPLSLHRLHNIPRGARKRHKPQTSLPAQVSCAPRSPNFREHALYIGFSGRGSAGDDACPLPLAEAGSNIC